MPPFCWWILQRAACEPGCAHRRVQTDTHPLEGVSRWCVLWLSDIWHSFEVVKVSLYSFGVVKMPLMLIGHVVGETGTRGLAELLGHLEESWV